MKQTNKLLSRTALLACVCVILSLAAFADAAVADETAQYTFCAQDFSMAVDGDLQGIYVKSVPQADVCRLLLGNRVVRSGDVLCFGDLDRLTLTPVTEDGGTAVLTYLPICDGKAGAAASYTMSIRATRDQMPVAQDAELSTYKNIANTGKLDASDPENGPLTYTVTTRPKHGTVEISEDGTFVYTPTHNKVGDDSFSYTVTDAAGNTSPSATVRIKILQPLDEATFEDLGANEQYNAMWMRQSGLFGGELLAGKLCFMPQRTVTRGEFLVMSMKLAGIDPEIGLLTSGFSDQADAPTWMQPYLVSAMRRGIVSGEASSDGLLMRPNDAVTQAEAVQIAANTFKRDAAAISEQSVPAMAQDAEAALLTRSDAAALLQRVLSV